MVKDALELLLCFKLKSKDLFVLKANTIMIIMRLIKKRKRLKKDPLESEENKSYGDLMRKTTRLDDGSK